MSDPTNNRKTQHIDIIQQDEGVDRSAAHFAAISLNHRAFPEIDLKAVDTSTTFLGKKLSAPLLISSMTGGDADLLRRINRNLASAAEECGIALAVGSQRVQFTHPPARESYELRKFAPSTVLISNLGAVQLNYGFGLAQAREAIDTVGADGLYLHTNPLQEAVQPEGDTNFAGLIGQIGELQADLDLPLLVKEVGSGISEADGQALFDAGIRYLDVAGHGGTSWSRIEHHRHEQSSANTLGMIFQDWGIPTPAALRANLPLRDKGCSLIASGGVRSSLDALKGLVLGADMVGMAAPFLAPAMQSTEAIISKINEVKDSLKVGMFLLGCANVSDLIGNPRHLRSQA